MKSIVAKKAKLIKKIDTYTKRRLYYLELSRRLTKDIRYLKERLKRTSDTKDKVLKLRKAVMDFTGVDIINRGNPGRKRIPNKIFVARGIYFKYGTENLGKVAKVLMEYVNMKYMAANLYRRNFTKSFDAHPENKKAFYDFKRYFDDQNRH